MCALSHSSSVRRARHEAALYLSDGKSLTLFLCGVLATRPHSDILRRQTLSLKFSLRNGRPSARSMEKLSAQLWKVTWEKLKCCLADSLSLCLDFSYGTVSHGKLSYSSVEDSIRRYHLQCVGHEAAWAAPAALASAAALLER